LLPHKSPFGKSQTPQTGVCASLRHVGASNTPVGEGFRPASGRFETCSYKTLHRTGLGMCRGERRSPFVGRMPCAPTSKPLTGSGHTALYNPLTSLEAIVSLIAATSTHKGLKVRSGPGTRSCPAGAKVSEAERPQILLRRDKFHGDWNYEIAPHP